MATQQVTDSFGTYYYIDSASSKDVLTWSQMQSNAKYFYNYCNFNYPNWTLNAISAILGNIQSEGIMNPSQWEYGYGMSLQYGYGLVQWTPATKYLNWCDENSYQRTAIISAILRLEYERSTGIQYYATSKYNFSFTSYLTDETRTVDTLARAWLYNYERPLDPAASEETRVSNAETWYKFLSGSEPEPPTPPEPPLPPLPPEPQGASKRLKPCYYHRNIWE